MVCLFVACLAQLTLGAPMPTFADVGDVSEADLRSARTAFFEGQRAYESGDFARAAERIRQAHALTGSPELAFNVARVYERMSEYDDAIRYFRIYLESRPGERERADVEGRVAELRAAQRRQREQVFTAPPSTDELTSEARTFFLRGVTMFRRRQYEAAMQAFTAAYRFAPLPEVVYNLAVTAERLESKQDAVDYYREYLRLRPSAPDRGRVERDIARLRGR